ncbi:hypothetical protein JZ00_03630 [Pseudomonas frederiksbergensis]|uniref:Uncharacterized protein n=1 Tax=Pseudomonas frederiksbergensis TaxID=104087 RepID=A0A0B1Z900_9PSED|nr:hypothetical protein JZ00_03630 [Pseudomonas frederiksbergensis]
MTQNLDIRIFTPDQLHERDINIATKVHQASVASVIRKVNVMNPGQVLNASRENGKELLWSTEKLEQVLRHIGES